METVLSDVRYGVRMLVKSPVVTGVAAVSLAVAIAVNAAAFAVVDAFLFEPLPYPDQDRLALAWQANPSQDIEQAALSPAQFLEMDQGKRGFRELAAYVVESANVTGGDRPEQVQAVRSTPDLLPMLGVEPTLGRGFVAREGVPGSDRVVVLTHDFWNRRYVADPEILGETVTLDGVSHTVVGVLGEDFEFIPDNVDLFTPRDFTDRRDDTARSLFVMGRLAPGADLDDAVGSLQAAHGRYADRHPEAARGWSVSGQSLRETFPGPTDTRLVLILTAVTLFGLVIACANVANLLLSRAEARQKEVAVRTALGAGRARILRQLLTESLVLSLVAGVLGSVGSVWVIKGLGTAMPAEMPQTFRPELDPGVLAAVLVVTLGAGVLFGLAPALYALKGDLRETLGEGSRGGTGSRARKRLRNAFVVGEFAVALALLSGAAFLGGAFERMINQDPGFDAGNLLTFTLGLPEERYPDDAALARFQDRLFESLEGVPGVEAVAAMTSLPRGRSNASTEFRIEGREPSPDGQQPRAGIQSVNPGYFTALGVELVRGRLPDDRDRADAAPVAVVNEAFVRRFLQDESAVGRRITLDGTSREIVGVVETIVQARLPDPTLGPSPQIYVPVGQRPQRAMAMALRTDGDAAALTGAVRQAVGSVDPDLPLGRVQTLERFIATSLAGPRVISIFLGLIGLVALALAAMGIYGVLAHAVAQQAREIGIRRAMGARGGQVVALVTGDGLGLVGLGLAAGTPLAWLMFTAVSRSLAGIGEVVSPLLVFGAVAGALSLVALLACIVPAMRAARVEPLRALRAE